MYKPRYKVDITEVLIVELLGVRVYFSHLQMKAEDCCSLSEPIYRLSTLRCEIVKR